MDAPAAPVFAMAVALMLYLAALRRGRFLRLHWRPDRHACAAVATGLLAVAMSAALLLVPAGSFASRVLHFVGIYGVCGALLPWWYVTRIEAAGAASMGLSRERLAASLALSLLAGAALFTRVLVSVDLSRVDPAYFARASYSLLAGGLFELFLYFGFIHLRLERAFGPLPAILGSAGIYTFWHVGTELPMHEDALSACALLFAVGLLYHAFFQITHNLASIWPFFFFGGVWVDFARNLDFPAEIARASGWVTLSWLILLATPVWLLRSRKAAHI